MTEKEQGIIKGMELINGLITSEKTRLQNRLCAGNSPEELKEMIEDITLKVDNKNLNIYMLGKVEELDKIQKFLEIEISIRRKENDK